MFKDIVENQDLYSKKDDFGKKIETKNSYFLIFKILYFETYLKNVYSGGYLRKS